MADLRKWYALRIKENWKEKVASMLESRGITCLSPVSMVGRTTDRRISSNEPGLMESLLFVKAEDNLLAFISAVKGIENFLYWRNSPALISEKEILLLRYFSEIRKDLFFEKIPVNPEGEIVLTSGPFLMMDGDSYDVKSKAIKAELPSLGYIVAAETDDDLADPALVLKSQQDISFIVAKR
jgi:transcription termination/antitermination protein NusG